MGDKHLPQFNVACISSMSLSAPVCRMRAPSVNVYVDFDWANVIIIIRHSCGADKNAQITYMIHCNTDTNGASQVVIPSVMQSSCKIHSQ